MTETTVTENTEAPLNLGDSEADKDFIYDILGYIPSTPIRKGLLPI